MVHTCKKHKKKIKNIHQPVDLVVHKESIASDTTQTVPKNIVSDSVWVMGTTTLWKKGFEGSGITIGILDTGIDDTHPALSGKVLKRKDYINDGKTSIDFHPHGTHLAGIICGNSVEFKGVAPKAILRDYRILNANATGTMANLIQAIRDATDDGCHIINLSLGGATPHPSLRAVIQYANSKGTTIVCAAGNQGAGRISYPAAYPEVISVGSVQFEPETGNITLPATPWFSNTNPEVDICTDGWNIRSSIPRNKYAIYSGTSMSAAHISGFCALMINMMTKKLRRAPSIDEIFSVLRSNTVEINFNTNLQGSGFCTLFSEIPKKVNGTWILSSFLDQAP